MKEGILVMGMILKMEQGGGGGGNFSHTLHKKQNWEHRTKDPIHLKDTSATK